MLLPPPLAFDDETPDAEEGRSLSCSASAPPRAARMPRALARVACMGWGEMTFVLS